MPQKTYKYVGPKSILEAIDLKNSGFPITEPKHVQDWIDATIQEVDDGFITATFIINEALELLISDRHSEHVMCAGGAEVVAAGEMQFYLEKEEVFVESVSNQSTGYCPEPDSWKAVGVVLDRIGLEHSGGFTHVYEFRYCFACENINLIKENVYECVICNIELDQEWNFSKH